MHQRRGKTGGESDKCMLEFVEKYNTSVTITTGINMNMIKLDMQATQWV